MLFGLITILLASSFSAQSTSASIPPCPAKDVNYKDPEHMVRPKYPKPALQAGLEGSVKLRAVIGSDGMTKELTLLTGPTVFTKPTLDAVRKWHFYPAVFKDRPAETTYAVEMRFVLNLQEAIPQVTLESPQQTEPSLPDGNNILNTPDAPVYRVSARTGVIAPKVLYQVNPEFSEKPRQANEQGTVIIRVIVGTDGVPKDLRVRCTTSPDLNENALNAVKEWRFSPGMKDGGPVMVEVDVEVEFTHDN